MDANAKFLEIARQYAVHVLGIASPTIAQAKVKIENAIVIYISGFPKEGGTVELENTLIIYFTGDCLDVFRKHVNKPEIATYRNYFGTYTVTQNENRYHFN